MSEHLRDPELDRLVHELNHRADEQRAGRTDAADPASPDPSNPSDIDRDVHDGATDRGDPEKSELDESGPGRLAAAALLDAGVPGAPDSPLGPAAKGPAALVRPRPHPAPVASQGTRFQRPEPSASLQLLSDLPARAGAGDDDALGALLADAIRRGASDLLLLPGLPPVFRIDGRLKRGESGPLDGDDIARLFQPQLNSRALREIEERGAADFSLRLPAAAATAGAPGIAPPRADGGTSGERGGGRRGTGDLARAGESWRFRVNVHRQRGQLAAALRVLPREIPSLAALNLPATLAELVKPSRGLVLVCGPTGSGKSSTLAALIGEINRTRTAHIITIEDPVEYEHRSNRSLIEHVEVGRDARSFNEALRAALRQDPDVILVGEMRDLDTVATAVTAAETGHLVLATLHSNDAVQAVHRIVDVFQPAQQMQIRQQLALSLHAIVAQQLVPRADGRGRLPAVELMLASFPVRHHIRSDQLQKLYNELTLGKRQGMTSFEESLAQLVREGKIDLDEARVRSSHPEELDSRLRG